MKAEVLFPAWPQVGKLVVACHGGQFTEQNPDELSIVI